MMTRTQTHTHTFGKKNKAAELCCDTCAKQDAEATPRSKHVFVAAISRHGLVHQTCVSHVNIYIYPSITTAWGCIPVSKLWIAIQL